MKYLLNGKRFKKNVFIKKIAPGDSAIILKADCSSFGAAIGAQWDSIDAHLARLVRVIAAELCSNCGLKLQFPQFLT